MQQVERKREEQLLVFSVAGRFCAFPLADVQEVVPRALLSTPPGLPGMLDGFLNRRGTLIPIVRMERLFDLPPGPLNLQTPLLIVRHPTTLLGLSVDRVLEVISPDLSESPAVATGSVFNNCVVAQVGFGDAAIHVLSMDRLLLEQERQTIDRWQTEMQGRLGEAIAQPQ